MKIAIAGGDRRMLTVGRLLKNTGYECVAFGFDSLESKDIGFETESSITSAMKNASAVVLPLPYIKGGFLNAPLSKTDHKADDIFEACCKDTLFIGGKLPGDAERFIDFSQREDFCLMNAVPTAEGAVALAMKELNTTIHGSNVLVIGYGRIGSYLSYILKALGANTFCVARRLQSRALAEISGIKAADFDKFEALLKNADIVFNTVPFKIFGQRELDALGSGKAIIDLASLPGGAEDSECEAHEVKLIRALALPGKVAPITAGEIVFKTVYSILAERGITP